MSYDLHKLYVTNGIFVVKSTGKCKNSNLCKGSLLKHVVLLNQLAYVISDIMGNVTRWM